jgi:tyrosyl-tRNA synthetase
MKKNLDKKIEEVLTKAVETTFPTKDSLKKTLKEKKIRLYLGVDPTSPRLHLGHTVPLRKLKEFQELGHEAILLFGTFTAQIGDPSGREEARKPLTLNQVKENMATYKKQASKIIDFSKVKIKYNGDWLSKLNFEDVIKLASNFTVSRLLERDMFQKRLKKMKEVWVSEFLYPLLQGYDSVAMNVDLEIGATDQTFNMLVGRKLQEVYNKKEKFVLTTPMLIGLDGKKMSKTYNNTVNLTDSPIEMYGKIMSLKDELIIHYFQLVTSLPLEEIKKIEDNLKKKKINPRDAKARLALEITAIFYGRERALFTEKEFIKVFREDKLPLEMPEMKIKKRNIGILELLVKTRLVSSKSEAKRLVFQKGIKINGIIQNDWRKIIKLKGGEVIQVGKRKFIRLL